MPTIALGAGSAPADVGVFTDVAGEAGVAAGACGGGGGWACPHPRMVRKATATLWTRKALFIRFLPFRSWPSRDAAFALGGAGKRNY